MGLVTGTCLAESGNDVVCVDKVAAKIEGLQQGKIPIYEPGLAELVHRNARDGRLGSPPACPRGSPRPSWCSSPSARPRATTAAPTSSGIWAVGREIAAAPDRAQDDRHQEHRPGRHQRRAGPPDGRGDRRSRSTSPTTPSSSRKGRRSTTSTSPTASSSASAGAEVGERLRELYEPFLRTDRPFLVMTPESAEMTKYVANCLLATKISFINEMANLCEAYGADINEVRRGIGHDQRIGFSFLFPGVGYGGVCFPKDVRAAIHMARSRGLPARMMEAVDAVNEAPEGRPRPQDPRPLRRRRRGQDRRHLGPGLQAPDRRHPRGPRARPDRRPARRGRLGPGPRSRGARQRPRPLRRSAHLLRPPLRRPRSRPTPWRSSPSGTSSATPTST